jgi:small subunit ribosomal protein S20
VANIKSQIKRNRTNEIARVRNKSTRSALKTAVRKFREASESGDAAAAAELARAASRALDKAVSKGVIHANQAANRKSAMAARAYELSQSA